MEKMLDVVFILDNSGSMSGSEESTISSFNEYLKKEKKNKFKTNITTVLFSDGYKFLHKRCPVNKVKPLTHKDYYVDGCTALYDAIGRSMCFMDKCKTDKVMFIIITDGYENASREFNKDKIKDMIGKSKYNFIYVGADIDSYAAGNSIGIDSSNIANFRKSKKGLNLLFKAFGNFECDMMEDRASDSWKEDLDNYIDENI